MTSDKSQSKKLDGFPSPAMALVAARVSQHLGKKNGDLGLYRAGRALAADSVGPTNNSGPGGDAGASTP
jgi:hypothetical protein